MLDFIALSSAVSVDSTIAIAASRAGALGVVDLEFATDHGAVLAELARTSRHARGRWGVQVADEQLLAGVLAARFEGLNVMLFSPGCGDRVSTFIERVRDEGLTAIAVVTDLDTAMTAQAAGAHAVVAKGHEAGGWIGEEGSFVLLQRLLATLRIPVWVQGGIGLRTVAAASVSGAAGAVLDSQLLLVRESPLSERLRSMVASMDGSETATVGSALGMQFRLCGRHDPGGLERLRALEGTVSATAPGAHDSAARSAWRSVVSERVGGGRDTNLLPLGQDASFAASLARTFETTAGVIAGLRDAAANAVDVVRRAHPFEQGSPLAQSHGTRYPIVQGPMTRVSDRAEFAAAVAREGALPFLALALMRAPEANELLARTRELLGDRPWGVGVLGFVPLELRAEQLDVVRAHRPPFALIAGGRPDQARELERDGITTYLHVPSPGLLRLYLADGARRFVFEGRECGGHVGPRTSFVLWDTMLGVLSEELPDPASDCHVLFAGGIHDARSAAMAAAAAASVTERGVRAGVLMGTAYVFTHEATGSGAITSTFQEAAVGADRTVLLESGPGHATRTLHSPFVEQFEAEKLRLRAQQLPADELRNRLEQLNIGRLRIATKGTDRDPRFGAEPGAPKLAAVDAHGQWERGMYMIGQIAALRGEVTAIADLHRDVADGSGELVASLPAPVRRRASAPPPADVAIIGLGCILPGAPDLRTFWTNVLEKVDAITEVPVDRWDWRDLFDADPLARDKVYSRWGGFIAPVPFSPLGLGLPPKSLSSIEPFQLLALLTAQAALQDAGYATRPFNRERTSVILGAGGGGADLSVGYTVRSALPSILGARAPDLAAELYSELPEWTEDSFPGLLMNVAAGRIANRLDFGGTNYTVDAACASSLSAVALGVRELQTGTSDVVLAGGIDAIQNPFAFLCFSKTRALSPRGRCRPFDAEADGIAISEGFATLVLKRLGDAERDGDRIYAVIRGVGAASDGRDRSLTAPRPEGQMRALRRAYAQADFSPATVGLVEAHGTGTVAGDGAEVQALSTVFAEHASAREWCAIGSVKSMIGHTKATAGVAGMTKAALALHHKVLPPTIGVSRPNPKADLPNSPFYVNTETRPWLGGNADHPRRAAVSAFGFGGTDFHVVLEEYTGAYAPACETVVERWPAELLLWRGNREAIATAIDSLAAQLEGGAAPSLVDLAATLANEASSAHHADPTLALVADSLDDLRAKLPQARGVLGSDAGRLHAATGVHWAQRPLSVDGRVAFLFPGQGSQFVDMARDLAIAFPEAREPFERADRILADCYRQPLSRYVFPPPSFSADEQRRRQAELTETHVAQAALGAVELTYLRALRELGVEPQLTGGHSYGEFVALCAAGGIDEDELLRLSEARGRLMAQCAAGEAGAMAAADAPPEALAPLLEDGVVVAANLNAPRQTVLSGPRDRIDAVLEWCRVHEIRARPLPVACAFHSPHVAGAQRQFAEALDRTRIVAPRMPVYSNTTGEPHAENPAAIAAVLAEHLARPVEFVRQTEAMYRDGGRIFVEVGPRAVLSGLVGQILNEREHLAVPLDRPNRSGLAALVDCLAALVTEGVQIDLARLFRGRARKRLDPQRIGAGDEDSAHPPGTWFVDGGRTWPAQADDGGALSSPSDPRQEKPAAMTESANGSGALAPLAAPDHDGIAAGGVTLPRSSVTAAPPAGPPAGAPPASADRVADVMSRYQHVMQQFLETQRDVMLGYLGAPRQRPVARRALADDLPLPAVARPLPAAASPPPSAPPPSAPPEPAADRTPEARGNGHAALTREHIQQRLLSVVSERTGYPPDMLGLDADLEGDLGIDSIKRVEIAGTLTHALGESVRNVIDVEKLTASRTLRDVIGTLADALAAHTPATGDPGAEALTAGPDQDHRPFEAGPADEERIGRFVVRATSAPPIEASVDLAVRGAVLIVDDGAGVGEALATALTARGQGVALVPGGRDIADHDHVRDLVDRVRNEHGGCQALVHLAALGDPGPSYGGLETLLVLAQVLREDLESAAADGGAAVLAATRLGGTFGVDGIADGQRVSDGAIAGFVKSLALEWPTLRVKAVDLCATTAEEQARQLLAELTATDGLTEVGYRDGERMRLVAQAEPLPGLPHSDPVDRDSVLLITGGARGITARVALALAERYRPTLVLVGRTPLEEEAAETASLADPGDLRRALIDLRRAAGGELTPALIERECRRILRGREVRDNLERIRRTGSRLEYAVCDVRDEEAFAALIDNVYETYRRVDGVIHGAGVIEDRLVRDKERESLQRVMTTKAGAAQTLAQKLRPRDLRFLVLFSSVSGRFGNRGQADYAAASEVLGKLAQYHDRRWPGRVVAINWGPWGTTGMVSAELEREFARRGVALLSPERGCELLIQELAHGRNGEAEVVLGAARSPSTAGAMGMGSTGDVPIDPGRLPLLAGRAEHVPSSAAAIETRRAFDLEHDRYLDDHRVDGTPVLPFAVAMELMAELAQLAEPTREMAALHGIRLFKGISVPDTGRTTMRLSAAPRSDASQVEVTIAGADTGRPHYRAAARLRDPRAPLDGAPPPLPLADPGPLPMSIEEAYRDLLFHGPLFQGIVQIEAIDELGSTALLRCSAPGDLVAHADGLEWLLDPVLIDSALQVQVVWARLRWDLTLLPAEIAAYTRFGAPAAGEIVRHELRIRPESSPPLCHADHWFYGPGGGLLATLSDVVGVGTQALNRLAQVRA